MATYFDSTSTADKNLLPVGVRSAAELANVAALAEAAVIGAYTGNPPYFLYTAYDAMVRSRNNDQPWLLGFAERGSGLDITATTTNAAQLRVFLQGYTADAADVNCDPNLKKAMRMTIAQVIRWWMVGWNRQGGVSSTSDMQAKTRAYAANADDAFPRDWDMLLRPFDSRPLPWGL